MKTYTITTGSGRTLTFDAETQADALRAFTQAYPGESVQGIQAGVEHAARLSMADAEI